MGKSCIFAAVRCSYTRQLNNLIFRNENLLEI